jgi:hypothetical protein
MMHVGQGNSDGDELIDSRSSRVVLRNFTE